MKERAGVLAFTVKFGVSMATFYLVLLIPAADRLMYQYLSFNAHLSGMVLNVLGFGTSVDRTFIASENFSILVRRGCDGVEPLALLVSALLAFPSSWPRRMAGLLAGGLVLFVLNVVRIVSLFWVGAWARPLFEKTHLEVWPVLFILAVLALFAGWVRWIRTT